MILSIKIDDFHDILKSSILLAVYYWLYSGNINSFKLCTYLIQPDEKAHSCFVIGKLYGTGTAKNYLARG